MWELWVTVYLFHWYSSFTKWSFFILLSLDAHVLFHSSAVIDTVLYLAESSSSRRDFFGTAAATAAAVTASWTGFAPAAQAAKYGSFGADSTQVIDPADAEVDDEIMASAAVQKAISKIRGYKQTVANIKASLDKNPQTNIKATILKELDFVDLRTTMNIMNTAFEEDTQRGTDRLIRNIIQDITELEAANNQKEGIERSPRRLEIMMGKLAKLDKAFDDLLAFAK